MKNIKKIIASKIEEARNEIRKKDFNIEELIDDELDVIQHLKGDREDANFEAGYIVALRDIDKLLD